MTFLKMLIYVILCYIVNGLKQESCHKYVNYDHPGECSPEKNYTHNLSGSHLQSQVNCAGVSIKFEVGAWLL